MAVSLQDLILRLYPNAIPNTDFEVTNHPDGSQEITGWWMDAPRPTERQLEDAQLPALKSQKITELHRVLEAECVRDFGSVWLAVAESPAALKTKAAKLRTLEAQVNQITQGATETIEDAVARVRAVVW
jgi:hypothetical protein